MNKITIFTVCFTILSSFHSVVWGQTISGKVIDNEQQPIVGATIILQSIDSTYISASVSDSNGEFILNKEPEEYRLVIQHLSYQTKQITALQLLRIQLNQLKVRKWTGLSLNQLMLIT